MVNAWHFREIESFDVAGCRISQRIREEFGQQQAKHHGPVLLIGCLIAGFPWGDAWDPENCNHFKDSNPAGGGMKRLQIAPLGSYRAGASPDGCMDMVGNADERVDRLSCHAIGVRLI
jgi:hypothetical protein